MHAEFITKIAAPTDKNLNKLYSGLQAGAFLVIEEGYVLRYVFLDQIGHHAKNYVLSPLLASLPCATVGNMCVAVATENGVLTIWQTELSRLEPTTCRIHLRASVCQMRLSPNGQFLSVLYEDGTLGMISDMNREQWSLPLRAINGLIEFMGAPLRLVLCLSGWISQLWSIDMEGEIMNKYEIPCMSGSEGVPVALEYSHHTSSLLVAFSSGRAQIMKSESDDEPLLMDCGRILIGGAWCPNSGLVALGSRRSVIFFNAQAQHLTTVDLGSTNGTIRALAWDRDGRHVGVAVDASLSVIAVRLDWEKCMFAEDHWAVMDSGNTLQIYQQGSGEKKVVAMKQPKQFLRGKPQEEFFLLLQVDGSVRILDSMGLCVSTHKVCGDACVGADICGGIVAAATGGAVYLWHWKQSTGHASDTVIQMADPTVIVSVSQVQKTEIQDKIVDISLCPSTLVVARQSGVLHIYNTSEESGLCFTKSFQPVANMPERIALNCDGSRLSLIDIDAQLWIVDTSAGAATKTARRKCWDLVWASDSPDMLACVDANRLFVVWANSGKCEEPIDIGDSTELLGLSQLEVVVLPQSQGQVAKFPCKALRDCRRILDVSKSLEDPIKFVADNPHPRLWNLIVETALLDRDPIDVEAARSVFEKSKCLQGVLLTQRLTEMKDLDRQLLESFFWFGRIDECRRRLSSRSDLMKELDERLKPSTYPNQMDELLILNDYSRICSMVNSCESTTELEELGRVLLMSGLIDEAVTAYLKAGNKDMAAKCCSSYGRWGLMSHVIGDSSNTKHTIDAIRTSLIQSGQVSDAVELSLNDLPEMAKLVKHALTQNPGFSPVEQKALALFTWTNLPAESTTDLEIVHLTILTHQQLYLSDFGGAVSSSLRLVQINACEPCVWKLLALASLLAGEVVPCSRAFTQLEVMDNKEIFRRLAFDVFPEWVLRETPPRARVCEACGANVREFEPACPRCGTVFRYCLRTGRSILKGDRSIVCTYCSKNRLVNADSLNYCPLCYKYFYFLLLHTVDRTLEPTRACDSLKLLLTRPSSAFRGERISGFSGIWGTYP